MKITRLPFYALAYPRDLRLGCDKLLAELREFDPQKIGTPRIAFAIVVNSAIDIDRVQWTI
jgi:hypothetical protein